MKECCQKYETSSWIDDSGQYHHPKPFICPECGWKWEIAHGGYWDSEQAHQELDRQRKIERDKKDIEFKKYFDSLSEQDKNLFYKVFYKIYNVNKEDEELKNGKF